MSPLPQRPRALLLRTFPARTLATAAAAVALAVAAAGVGAERADRDKPLNFAADNLRYDSTKQTNVLTGNVLITKGTMTVKATRVEVRQTPEGHQFAVAFGGGGKPAHYRQKRDGVDEYVEGEADRIEYDGRNDIVKLIGNAVTRRYRGTTLADEITGPLITYDNVAEVFTVDGSGATTGSSGGRVRGVLTPAPAASAPQQESR
jgi:lipopolysaccharide export system protein LptA